MPSNRRGDFVVYQTSWPKRLSDFDRPNPPLRVKLRREVTTGAIVLPTGALGQVEAGSRWDRLDFKADKCKCCGVKMRLRAPVNYFELIDDDGNSLP